MLWSHLFPQQFGYVVDTITKPCFTINDIWSAMEFADKNRSVGSHALNPESSRAHTIYQINYCQEQRAALGWLWGGFTSNWGHPLACKPRPRPRPSE